MENRETLKHGAHHEGGHFLIANALGYDGIISVNPDLKSGFMFQQTSPVIESAQGFKNQILIAFGGLGVEDLLGLEHGFGYIGDVQIACKYYQKLEELNGRDFNFRNYMDFPEDQFNYYLDQSKIVLNKIGGIPLIKSIGENIFKDMLNLYKDSNNINK